ncbi:MAG: hypothetical protein ABSC08_20515 [Bryobacteraceae bacterium]|jgi:hypothetical protein
MDGDPKMHPDRGLMFKASFWNGEFNTSCEYDRRFLYGRGPGHCSLGAFSRAEAAFQRELSIDPLDKAVRLFVHALVSITDYLHMLRCRGGGSIVQGFFDLRTLGITPKWLREELARRQPPARGASGPNGAHG